MRSLTKNSFINRYTILINMGVAYKVKKSDIPKFREMAKRGDEVHTIVNTLGVILGEVTRVTDMSRDELENLTVE